MMGCTRWCSWWEALSYKPEGRGFDSWRGHCDFSLTYSFRPHYGSGVDASFNRNGYQEYLLRGKNGRSVGRTTLPPACAEIVWKLWKLQAPGVLYGPVQARKGIALACAHVWYVQLSYRYCFSKLNVELLPCTLLWKCMYFSWHQTRKARIAEFIQNMSPINFVNLAGRLN
jgi:hypothetical protein